MYFIIKGRFFCCYFCRQWKNWFNYSCRFLSPRNYLMSQRHLYLGKGLIISSLNNDPVQNDFVDSESERF